MINLKNKTALITGGSRGLGKAMVILFARAGCDVFFNYRSDDKSAGEVREEAQRFGVRIMSYKADISRKAEVDRMVDAAVKEFGRIDILVNNAGIWEHNPIDDMTEERLKDTININVLGSFYTAMAVVPHMKRQKSGNIINISSTAGQRGEAFHSPYAASKSAVIGMTKSLAPELAEYNIRVNCVAPGWFETDMSHDALLGDGRAKVTSQIPLGRVGDPDELAGPVLFMASDLSTFITGEVLNVNGGAVLCG